MSRSESPVNRRPSIFRRTDEGVPELTEDREVEKVPRSKRTYYLPDDVVMLLEEMQFEQRRKTGVKPELSDLVAEGIRLLGRTRQQEV